MDDDDDVPEWIHPLLFIPLCVSTNLDVGLANYLNTRTELND